MWEGLSWLSRTMIDNVNFLSFGEFGQFAASKNFYIFCSYWIELLLNQERAAIFLNSLTKQKLWKYVFSVHSPLYQIYLCTFLVELRSSSIICRFLIIYSCFCLKLLFSSTNFCRESPRAIYTSEQNLHGLLRIIVLEEPPGHLTDTSNTPRKIYKELLRRLRVELQLLR